MDVDGIISAIVAGLVIGFLARLIVPGKQAMGILLTLLVGLVGAFGGGFIAATFTSNFWLTLLVQVALAAVLVVVVAGRDRKRLTSR